MKRALLAVSVLSVLSFRQSSESVKQLSLDFSSRILEKGKYITVSGEVYFRRSDGLLTTHLVKPFENITIVNAAGEMKIYDPGANTLVHNTSALNTTESSYFWHFLNGSYNDLGFSKVGYVISSSKIDNGLLVTNWVPRQGFSSPITNIELVHEKSLPVYVAFRNSRQHLLGKIYFSGYSRVGTLNLPSKITEFSYANKDSTVTTKKYSNPKVNAAVNEKFLDFRIPSNAKVLATQ